MNDLVALHGAGDRPRAFAEQLRTLVDGTPHVRWTFASATRAPDPSDRLHYAGLGAAAFSHPCWDLERIAEAVRGRIVLGFSMGAIAALRLLHREPTGPRAVVCLAGCYSMLQLLGDAYTAPAGPVGPVLFVHGADDRRIPVRLSRECAERLAGTGGPVDHWVVPRAGHSVRELGLTRPGPTLDRLRAWIGDLT